MDLKAEMRFADIALKSAFDALEKGDAQEKQLHCSLVRAFNHIKHNVFCGAQVPKKLIPREYLQKYRVDNLWKCNLPGAWRLLYSVEKEGITVVAILLEWLNHKSYEKRFGY